MKLDTVIEGFEGKCRMQESYPSESITYNQMKLDTN